MSKTDTLGDGGILKLDSDGNALWAKAYYFYAGLYPSVIELPDSSIAFCGYLGAGPSSGAGQSGYYRIDSMGVVLGTSAFSDFSPNNQSANQIYCSKLDSSIYVVFTRRISKYSKSGTFIRAFDLAPQNNLYNLSLSEVVEDSTGSLYFCGTLLSNQSFATKDGIVLKSDTLFNLLFSNTYSLPNLSSFRKIHFSNNNLFVTGTEDSVINNYAPSIRPIIICMNLNGNVNWVKGINSTYWASESNSLISTGNKIRVLTTDYIPTSCNAWNTDISVVALDFSGNVLSSFSFGDCNENTGGAFEELRDGSLVIGTCSNNNFTWSSQVVFIKTDSTGSSPCFSIPTQPHWTSPRPVTVSPFSIQFTSNVPGPFWYLVDSSYLSTGNWCPTDGITENHLDLHLNVYPNPASHEINIIPSERFYFLSIYNGFGQCVKEMSVEYTGDIHIHIEDLAPGMYSVRAVAKQRAFTSRFIKE